MRLLAFQTGSDRRFGVEWGHHFVDVNLAARSRRILGTPDRNPSLGANLLEMLRLGPEALDSARRILRALDASDAAPGGIGPADGVFPASSSRRLAPIRRPGKIVCVGRNYADHCAEQNRTPPEKPLFFTKSPTSVIGDGDPIDCHPGVTSECDYEGELAVVIGKEGRNIPVERAHEHVAGFTIVNDVTARDLQRTEKQWTRAKGLDTFCPMGPCIVTSDEIPDPHGLDLRCLVNGEPRQASNTRHLIFRVPDLVSRLSRGLTLEPGDVLSTGTPGGVGAYMDPPRFLADGDEVRIEIDGIGSITNGVRALA
jgi:2-keto-4-pentenoate hydratase/2-oxohepta-3-ene-1,7-dioic acid hydratase in catechol pathway